MQYNIYMISGNKILHEHQNYLKPINITTHSDLPRESTKKLLLKPMLKVTDQRQIFKSNTIT